MAKLTLARIVFLRMFRWLVDEKGSFCVKNLTENRTKKRVVSQQVDENTVGGFTNNIDFFRWVLTITFAVALFLAVQILLTYCRDMAGYH